MDPHAHSSASAPTTPERRPLSAPEAEQASHSAHAHIPGWGVDLDHKNRPAYPKERTPPRLDGLHWEQPEAQPLRMKIYHSTERPGLTPVFGTSTPPSGLSGKLRAFAYRLSENDIRHWLLLMFADRVNMVEGLLQDLRRGHVPNILAEMGAKAEWKYNRAGFIRKALATIAIGGGAYYLVRRRKGVWGQASEANNAMLIAKSDWRDAISSARLDTELASQHLAPDFVRNVLLASAIVGAAVYLIRIRMKN